MISTEKAFFKKISLWCLIVFLAIAGVCLIFISCVSLWTGIMHTAQDGFWMPVLGGAILLSATLVFFIRTTKFILSYMKDEDMFIV